MGTVAEATDQVAEIEEMTKRTIGKQMNNLAEGERLLKSTQEMNQLAQAFQKDAHEMEII